MTQSELDRALQDCHSWVTAPVEANDAFAEEMAEKIYGERQTLNAWLWFYSGWCAHSLTR